MEKITALIIAFNEEEMLPGCLDSAAWADEILVVDSFSTDRTVEIARSRGARVLQNPFTTHARQKNWAIPQASHEWLIILDADERATDELRDEIRAQLENGPDCDGYAVYRRSYFFGREIRHCGWDRDKVIRFVRRDRARYVDVSVHEEIEVDGKMGHLRGKILHFTYRDFDQLMEKLGRYTSLSAEDLHRRGKRPGTVNLTLRPLWRFAKMYLLRRGFLDGKAGLILCGLSACYVFVKYAKLWHLRRNGGKG